MLTVTGSVRLARCPFHDYLYTYRHLDARHGGLVITGSDPVKTCHSVKRFCHNYPAILENTVP